jgi:hypothetical protein
MLVGYAVVGRKVARIGDVVPVLVETMRELPARNVGPQALGPVETLRHGLLLDGVPRF